MPFTALFAALSGVELHTETTKSKDKIKNKSQTHIFFKIKKKMKGIYVARRPRIA